MVSTLIHALSGTVVALAFDFPLGAFIILTNLPDIDEIPDIFLRATGLIYHRKAAHNLFALAIFAAIGAFFDPWLVLAAAGLHLALDLFHGGIAPFWPLSGKLYYLTDFGVKGKPFWYYLIYEGSPLFTIISLVLFAAFLLAFFW